VKNVSLSKSFAKEKGKDNIYFPLCIFQISMNFSVCEKLGVMRNSNKLKLIQVKNELRFLLEILIKPW
jgi:hypothetical protein